MSTATIPTAPPTRPITRRDPQHTERAPVARVLLVEDEPVTAEVFARALQAAGHQVRIVRDGMQALHALRDEAPEVVVLDLGLPTVPGLEVLRRLRSSEHRDVPVVVVSGAADRFGPDADGLFQPGLRLLKPLRPRELVAAVRSLRQD